MKRIIIATLALAVAASCAKDDAQLPVVDGDNGVVAFGSASISSRVTADGLKWEKDDLVGITMYNVGAENAETLADKCHNIKYISDIANMTPSAESGFTVVTKSESLLYPNTGNVRFYAYYPYQDLAAASTTYSANVADQSKEIDFMTARTANNMNRKSGKIALNFTHELALLTFTITCNETVTDLTGLTVSITGLNTQGGYSILSGDKVGALSANTVPIVFNTIVSGKVNASAQAIILPEVLAADVPVTFTIGTAPNERVFKIKIPRTTDFIKSKKHHYNVALGNDMADFVSNSTITGWGTTGAIDDTLYTEEK